MFLIIKTCKQLVCPSQAANLQGVKMLCTNAEGASLRGCNFEDPAGIKANLEGEEFDHWLSDVRWSFRRAHLNVFWSQGPT